MSANPSIILIDSKLGPIYEKIVQERGNTEPTQFQIEKMRAAINAEKTKLLNERQKIEDELEIARKTQQAAKKEFQAQLTGGRLRSAENCLKYSKELSAQCSDLYENFARITDRIDSASTILNRARAVKLYLEDIRIYNTQDNLHKVLNDIDYMAHHENDSVPKIAENVAKLKKIATVARKHANLEKGARNLDAHADKLIVDLTKLITETDDTEKIHDYIQSKMLLQPDEIVLTQYIDELAIFKNEEAVQYQFAEEFLNEGFRSLQDRYEHLCNYASQECLKLFPDFDIIFDRPVQAKHALLMKVCTHFLQEFVDRTLDYYENDQNFCKMLMYLYETTSNMLTLLFQHQTTTFITATYLDKLFKKFQQKYREYETTNVSRYLANRVQPALIKLEQVYKQTNFMSLFKKSDEIINPFDIFNDEIPHELLSSAKEALVRCFHLSPPEDLSDHFSSLMNSFFETTFYQYLTSVISACSFYLSKLDSPQLIAEYIGKFIKLVTLVNSNVLSLEEAYKNTLKAIMRPLSGAHTAFIKFKTQLIEKLENETVKGLENCLILAISHSKKILSSKQKRADFLPGQSSLPFSSGPSSAPKFFERLTSKGKIAPSPPPEATNINPEKTEACAALSAFIRSISSDVNMELDGENRVSFLSELGRILLTNVIYEHLCQYKYNFLGAKQLFVDVAEYQAALDTFKIDLLTKRVMELSTASLWMTVEPQTLSELIRSQPQSKRTLRVASRLLQLRVDAKEIDMDIFH